MTTSSDQALGTVLAHNSVKLLLLMGFAQTGIGFTIR